MCFRPEGCGKEENLNFYVGFLKFGKNLCCGNLTQSFICYRSLVVPMRWPIGSNSCTEADPVQSLSEPLASFSMRDDSESSSTTFK